MEKKYTPGPWRWEISEVSKSVKLTGGKPNYDLYVMDFVRWGTQNASPRFITDGLMHPAKEHSEVVTGREHHAQWFKSINHPDAKLIAAAPDLLEACNLIFTRMQQSANMSEAAKEHYEDAMILCEAAINKALK